MSANIRCFHGQEENVHIMLMVNSVRLIENMETFIKKRTSLCGTVIQDEGVVRIMSSVANVLDGREPMRVPMQAM